MQGRCWWGSTGTAKTLCPADKVWTPKRWLSKSEVLGARSSLWVGGREDDGTGGSIAKGWKIILRHGQMSFYSIDLSGLHSHPSFKSGKVVEWKSDMKEDWGEKEKEKRTTVEIARVYRRERELCECDTFVQGCHRRAPHDKRKTAWL